MNISPVSFFSFFLLLAIHSTPVLPLLSFPLISLLFTLRPSFLYFTFLLSWHLFLQNLILPNCCAALSIQCTLTNTYVNTSNKHTYITQTHVHNSHTHHTQISGFWVILALLPSPRKASNSHLQVFRPDSILHYCQTSVCKWKNLLLSLFYLSFLYSLLVKSFFRLHLDQ